MQRPTNRLGFTSLSLSIAPLAIALSLAGCGSDQKTPEEPDGPMEKAGEKVDEGAEDAAEGAEDAAEETGEKVDEGAEDAAEGAEDAAEATEAAVDDKDAE